MILLSIYLNHLENVMKISKLTALVLASTLTLTACKKDEPTEAKTETATVQVDEKTESVNIKTTGENIEIHINQDGDGEVVEVVEVDTEEPNDEPNDEEVNVAIDTSDIKISGENGVQIDAGGVKIDSQNGLKIDAGGTTVDLSNGIDVKTDGADVKIGADGVSVKTQ